MMKTGLTIVTACLLTVTACAADEDNNTPPSNDGGPDTQVADTAVGDTGGETSTDAPGDASDTTAPTSLVLPGDKYYPESLNAAADGTLYVGSLGTGEVVKFAPGSTTAVQFVAPGDPKGVTGVFVDGAGGQLWLCAVDLSVSPPATEVRAYDLASGAKKTTLAFSSPAFCNDFALDAAGTLYVADSFGKVWSMKKTDTALSVWSSDPLLATTVTGGFGADGIALDGAGNLFVTVFSDGRLVKIPINGDGTAGTAVDIAITPKLQTADGMRSLDATTFVVADGNAGALAKLVISGSTATSSTIGTGLNGPTSVVKVGTTFWVSEGQLGHLTGAIAGPPTLPFDVKAVPAG